MSGRRIRHAAALFFLAAAVLFLIANRGAYEGYFHGDDLDNLSWTRDAQGWDFLTGIVTPRYFPWNFRPAGHFYFFVMGRASGLDFPPYVAVLQLLHFINVGVLWLILRRLDVRPIAAACGALLFAFHWATFDAYWRPMYIFDVLCGTFCLLCLLAYLHGRWVIGLLFLWLAYKSKELAVMLPAVLAVYEFTIGERKWKRLLPYFAISMLFGVQSLVLNENLDNAYTMRFSFDALRTTVSFYAPWLAPLGWFGLALLLLPFYFPDRRIWFGLAMAGLILFPMLLLPGRLFSVYLYVPLAGLVIAWAAFLSRWHWAVPVLVVMFWLPWNYTQLRHYRRGALTVAADNRAYVQGIAQNRAKALGSQQFLFDGAPDELHRWGVEAALRLNYNPHIQIKWIGDKERFTGGEVALLTWDPVARTVHVAAGSLDQPRASYVRMDPETPVWQLKEGWYPREDNYRWIKPKATAWLHRPQGASVFEVVVNAPPVQIREVGRVELTVIVDGRVVGKAVFTTSAMHKVRWKIPASKPWPAMVEFLVRPAYRTRNDPRTFGVAIVSFGFYSRLEL